MTSFAVACCLLPVAYAACLLLLRFCDGASKGSPSCPCGAQRLSDAYMMHSSEYDQLCAQLTALCTVCSCNARNNTNQVTLGDIRPEGGF